MIIAFIISFISFGCARFVCGDRWPAHESIDIETSGSPESAWPALWPDPLRNSTRRRLLRCLEHTGAHRIWPVCRRRRCWAHVGLRVRAAAPHLKVP